MKFSMCGVFYLGGKKHFMTYINEHHKKLTAEQDLFYVGKD
jgi:hypothetical protein